MSVAPGPSGPSLGNVISGTSDLFGAAGSLIQGSASAAGDQAAAQGYSNEASLYQQAATLATNAESVIAAEGQVETSQIGRQVEEAEGTAGAVQGAGNVQNNSSTFQAILHETQQQGALAIGQANLQTALQENNFQTIATAYNAQAAGATAAASAAKSAAGAASAGGFLGALGGVAGFIGKFL